MKRPPFKAFTTKFNGRTNVLHTKIIVSQAHEPNSPEIFQRLECKAIWDTGATGSVITEALARKLNLKPFTKVWVTNTSGSELKDAYLVNIILPSKVLIHHLRATECEELVGDFDFLIGMDIIGAGDFSVTHADSKTTMSYRIPSIETVDYVEQFKIQAEQTAIGEKFEEEKAKRKQKFSKEFLKKKHKQEKLKKRRLAKLGRRKH